MANIHDKYIICSQRRSISSPQNDSQSLRRLLVLGEHVLDGMLTLIRQLLVYTVMYTVSIICGSARAAHIGRVQSQSTAMLQHIMPWNPSPTDHHHQQSPSIIEVATRNFGAVRQMLSPLLRTRLATDECTPETFHHVPHLPLQLLLQCPCQERRTWHQVVFVPSHKQPFTISLKYCKTCFSHPIFWRIYRT